MIKIIFWTLTGIFIYTYIGYPLLLFFISSIVKHKPIKKSDITPSISFFIAAYNEENIIEKKIKNCLKIDYPRDKIKFVFASDGSKDETNSIIKKYSKKNKQIKLLDYKIREGKVNILNKSIPKLKGDIIILSDATTMYHKDSVKKIIRNFNDNKVGCVLGNVQFINPNKTPSGSNKTLYRKYEDFLKEKESKLNFCLGTGGACYAIRKKLFEKLPKKALIEDFILPQKIWLKGYKVIYEKEAITKEITARKVKGEFDKLVRISVGGFQTLFWLYPLLNPSKGFISIAYLSHKVLRWFGGLFLLGIFISNFLLIKIFFYRILFTTQFVCYLITLINSFIKIRIKPIIVLHYFLSMNIATLIGFFKFILGKQKVTWKKTN